MTAPVVIYTTGFCGYCSRARKLLEQKGVGYEEIRVDGDAARRAEMIHRSGRRTVPQYALERAGGLDELLKQGIEHG